MRLEAQLLSPYPKKAIQLLNGCWIVPPSKCRPNEAQIWENNGQMAAILSKTFYQELFESHTKSPDFEWSGFQVAGTIARPFDNWTIWNPIFKKSKFW